MLRIDGLLIPPCPHPIALEVAPGETVALVDREGAFGPRLVDLLSLARPPRHGTLRLFGTDLRELDPAERPGLRRRLGFVFPDLRLEGRLSALQTLELAAHALGRRPGDYGAPCAQLLRWIQLGEAADAPVESLERPAQRRLSLARALVNRPELLVAHDPAAGLDEAEAGPLLRLLAQLREAGTAMLLIVRSGESASAELGSRVVEPGVGAAAAEADG